MQRMKTYDVPHKGLRNALSQLSLLAGSTDYKNSAAVEKLCLLGRDVFSLLTVHAADENEVTLSELEKRCPGCSQHDVEDHENIHQTQDNLERLLADIHADVHAGKDASEKGDEFYLAFSEFHGVYLEHTAEEERVTQPLLWQHFTDEELAAHRGKIMGKLSPQVLLTWFKFVVPAQSPEERSALLSGFRKMAAEPFFREAMGVIEKVLSSEEYQFLQLNGTI
ncbi:MAG: hypothetical protein JST68_23410 [Bacteroidetes bacterium]|nr:hypothetical protein [Bacteroidota bacterium]